jgi:hypothetical protein
MAKKQATKRQFGFNTTALATAPLTIEAGIYAGQVCNASIASKEGKSYFAICQDTIWDDKATNEKTGKKGASIPTGEYTLRGSIFYGAILTSKKAIQELQRDEPKVFGGQIRLEYYSSGTILVNKAGEEEDASFFPKESYVLGAFLEALGLLEHDFNADVDFEYNENILEGIEPSEEYPAELLAKPYATELFNSLAYQKALFAPIAEAANHVPVKVMVTKQASRQNKTLMENVIDTGRYNSQCGLLPYTEGAENDL